MSTRIVLSILLFVAASLPCAFAEPGETCGSATLTTGTLPFTDTGNYYYADDDYWYSWDCGSTQYNSGMGPDIAYRIQTTTACTLKLDLVSTQLPIPCDVAFWVVTDCDDIATGCVAGADEQGATGPPESITFDAAPGVDYFIVLDDVQSVCNGTQYELTITETTSTGCMLGAHGIFADGFESGNTASWTAVEP